MTGSDENGDNGIGDDNHSWGYDGFRKKLWNGQQVNDDTPDTNNNVNNDNFNNTIQWNIGDIIGCQCDILIESSNTSSTSTTTSSPSISIRFSYYNNGNLLGVAFNSQSNISLRSLLNSVKDGITEITPALTLEQGESLVINIGQRVFKYPPIIENNDSILFQSIYDIVQSNKSKISKTQEDISVIKELELIEELKVYNKLYKEYQNEIQQQSSAQSVTEEVEKKNEEKSEEIAIATIKIDLESNEYQSANDLLKFGLDGLKNELIRRGLKSGGTLQERADRLWSVRGIKPKHIDKKLRAKK